MKRLTIFLTAVISVWSLSWSLYAASNSGMDGMPSDRSAGSNIAGKDLRGLNVVNQDGKAIGEIQAVNFDSKTGRITSVTVKELAEKNYSPAPMLKNRNDNSGEQKMQSPMFQYLYENVGR